VDNLSTKYHQLGVKDVENVSEDARKGIVALVTKLNASQSSHSGSVDLDLFNVR